MTPLLLPLPGNEPLGHSLADRTGWPIGAVEQRHFPDEETYVRLDLDGASRSVVIVCTLDRPDPRTLPLLFAADAARDLGAARVGLVAPYLAYMRQDRRFQPGEAITSRTFADLLSSRLDWLLTVDPHLHRYRRLEDLYRIPARVVHAAPALATWIAANVDRPLLIGPDEESAQWVADVGARAGAPYVVLTKVRHGDRDVEVSVPNLERHGHRTPVILDDIVSSAHTMIQTVKHLARAGAAVPVCVGVHGLFAGDAEQALRDAGAGRIVTTNSVSHATNAIELEDLLLPGLRDLAE